MAVPMRKKRAWSTREDDAESQETAAFEATVAAAKDTAAKSGAFLSTAKSDLTDHQRWLQAQSVAVERDRRRHERWLQRQRDHRLAAARKDRQRRRRQLMRQRAFRAMQQAGWAGMLFIRSWILFVIGRIGAGFGAVGRLIASAAAFVWQQIVAGARWVLAGLGMLMRTSGRGLAAGAARSGAALGSAARQTGKGLSAGAAWSGAKMRASAKAGGGALASSSRSAGRSLGSGFSAAASRGSVLADVTGRSASHGLAVLGTQASALGAAGKRGLARGFGWTKRHAAALGPTVYVRMAKLGRQAERYARTRSAGAKPVAAPPVSLPAAAPVHVIEVYGPHLENVELFGRSANDPWTPSPETEAAAIADLYGPFREGFRVAGVSPNEPVTAPDPHAVAARAESETALSSWIEAAGARAAAFAAQARLSAGHAGAWVGAQASRGRSWTAAQPWAQKLAETPLWGRLQTWTRTRDIDLSQMMIIAGAVLLICGGLLIGGGLFLRGGAGPTMAQAPEEESVSGIAWTFDDPDRPLAERAVFTLSGTPEAFRINGLSVSGVNQSDHPLTAIEAVLKPDVQRPDLKLSLKVDKAAAAQVDAGEGQALAIAGEGTVPANAPFRLVFPFPPEAMDNEDGITVEEFFDSYGGLLLKLRYEVDGAQKSLIQYLGPDLLKSQLDEVSAQAAGG
jgi:hypothetical protein